MLLIGRRLLIPGPDQQDNGVMLPLYFGGQVAEDDMDGLPDTAHSCGVMDANRQHVVTRNA